MKEYREIATIQAVVYLVTFLCLVAFYGPMKHWPPDLRTVWLVVAALTILIQTISLASGINELRKK